MKHNWRRKLKIVIVLYFFTGSFVRLSASSSSYQTIRAGVFFADGFFESKDIGYSGYAYDIYVNLAQVNRYRYEFVECSLAKCLDMLSNHEIDVLSGISMTDSRNLLYEYTNIPIGIQSGSLYVRDESIPYGSFDHFHNLKIGLMFKDQMSARFIDLMVDAKVSLTPVYQETYEQIRARYESKEIDGYVSHNLDPVKDAKRVFDFERNYIYMIAAKGNRAFVDELNQGLAVLKRNGIIKTNQFPIIDGVRDSFILYFIVFLSFVACFGFAYFVNDQQKEHKERTKWKNKRLEILNAIYQQEFLVVYQPIVDCQKLRIAHLEALIRWNHKNLGLLTPFAFLDDVFHCGMMFYLFSDTLQMVLRDYTKIFAGVEAFQHEEFYISINVSYEVLIDDQFIHTVSQSLEAHECSGQILCFEVTEQSKHDNIDLFNRRLQQLRDLGCRVAMDDFGMEFSSLLSLKQSDFDIYKIDKYFIDDILTDKTAQSIANAIIAISKLLGKHVIAEGVETAAQVNQVVSMDCYLIQGYYFSKPKQPDVLLENLDELIELIQGGIPYETKR